MAKHINTPKQLVEKGLLSEEQQADIAQVAERFSIGISAQVQDAIVEKNNADPIYQQFVPTVNELTITPEEQADPIGDQTHSPIKGIVHRYPDRCLLLPVQVCAVYCRYCFRREKVGAGNQALTAQEIESALDYIASQPNIWEVILTGGDPLMLQPKQLAKIMQRLDSIDTVQVVRIHTRIPTVDTKRVTDELLAALRLKNKRTYLVLHVNHKNELHDKAKQTITRLLDAGFPLLSQSVLLKNINDNITALSELMRALVSVGVKPYYLHHADLAQGTAHFRTSIAAGIKLVKQLRGRFSGLCQPTYVLDIPGGYGKIPLQYAYLQTTDDANYVLEDYLGQLHDYT